MSSSDDLVCDKCRARVSKHQVVKSRFGEYTPTLEDAMIELQKRMSEKRGEVYVMPEYKQFHRKTVYSGGIAGRYGSARPRSFLCGPLRDQDELDVFLVRIGAEK